MLFHIDQGKPVCVYSGAYLRMCIHIYKFKKKNPSVLTDLSTYRKQKKNEKTYHPF